MAVTQTIVYYQIQASGLLLPVYAQNDGVANVVGSIPYQVVGGVLVPVSATQPLPVTSTAPPIRGFGNLTLTNASAALSGVTTGPNSAAWPTAPGLVFVTNTGLNPAFIAPLGGVAVAATCIPLQPGQSYGFSSPVSGMTAISTLGTTLSIAW